MICCIVYIDGSLTGERYTFACVPRIGESVTIPKSGNTQTLTVKNVVHVAEGAYEDEPECVVQVHASTKARRKAWGPEGEKRPADAIGNAVRRNIRLEPARSEDAEAMLTVHRAAIRGEAARFYSAEIIDDWGPLPIRAENVGGLADRMIRGEEEAVVARDDATGRVVGFGSIVPAAEELRAVYVAPDHQRSGIGSMIVAELEARARKHGLSKLSMDASLNSERFYRHHGFEVEGRGEHVLHSGRRMACVRMRKLLGTDCWRRNIASPIRPPLRLGLVSPVYGFSMPTVREPTIKHRRARLRNRSTGDLLRRSAN